MEPLNDEMLVETSDWTASQGEALMETNDETEMENAAKQAECYYELLKKNKSVTMTKSLDELCLARALVTVKAHVDKDPQYPAIRRGREFQRFLAHQLHEESGVPKGKCGYKEVQRMQEHLYPQGYQMKVFEATRKALWFCDPFYDSATKKTEFV